MYDLEVSCFLSWAHSRLLLSTNISTITMYVYQTDQSGKLVKVTATRVTMSSQSVPKVTLTAKSFECKSWGTYLHIQLYILQIDAMNLRLG